MGVREELLSAVQVRLEQVAALRDLSPVLEPSALAEARRLTEILEDDDGDLQARYTLGWLHWYFYQALPQRQDRQDLDAAIAMFTPCFITGSIELARTAAAHPRRTGDPHRHRLAPAGARLPRPEPGLGHVRPVAAHPGRHPADHPDRAMYLSNLGDRAADPVRAHRRAGGPRRRPSTARPGRGRRHPRRPPQPRPGACPTSGNALLARFERTGAQADLDAAIEPARPRSPPPPPATPTGRQYLSNLGIALRTRFERTGAQADLDAAIRPARPRWRPPPPTTPTGPCTCPTSGSRCGPGSSAPGRRRTWTPAIEAHRAAVAGHPRRPPRPGRAPVQPGDRAADPVRAHRGSRPTWTPAIEAGQAAVEATPADHPDRAAVPVQPRERAADPVRAHRGAGGPGRSDRGLPRPRWRPPPPATPTGPRYLSNLGIALRTRFERTGALADLDAGDRGRPGAVDATPAGHPDRAVYLSNLGAALRTRFERTGAQADLDAAIDAGQAAVDGHPRRPPRPGRGTCPTWGPRCGPGSSAPGAQADLDAAIERRPGRGRRHPGRPPRPGHVPVQPRARAADPVRAHRGAGGPGRGDRGRPSGRRRHPRRPPRPAPRTCPTSGPRCGPGSSAPGRWPTWTPPSRPCQAAVDATPADHPNRARYLSNLGSALQTRFERTGALADLDAAIEAGQAAVDATPAGHPDRADVPVQPRGRAADPVRAHRGAGGPRRRDQGRPGRGGRHPRRPPRPGRVPVQPGRRAADPVRAHRGSRPTWTPRSRPARPRSTPPPPTIPTGPIPVQPRDRAADPVRAHRGAGGPGCGVVCLMRRRRGRVGGAVGAYPGGPCGGGVGWRIPMPGRAAGLLEARGAAAARGGAAPAGAR